MGKCIFTGEETSNQYALYGKTVFIKPEIYNQINIVTTSSSLVERTKAYNAIRDSQKGVTAENKELVNKLNSWLESEVNKTKMQKQPTEPIKSNTKEPAPFSDEKLIKRWEYQQQKSLKHTRIDSLTLSNKRLIFEQTTDSIAYTRSEIMIKDIISVTSSLKESISFWTYIIFIIALGFLFGSITSFILGYTLYLILGGVFLFTSIIFIVSGIYLARHPGITFSIVINTIASTPTLTIGANKGTINIPTSLSTKIDYDAATDISKHLSNIIFKIQQGKY